MTEIPGLKAFQRGVEAVKHSFGLAGEKAVEAGREKVVDLLNASKEVLNEYKNNAIEAFANFPNKIEFAHATIVAVLAGVIVGVGGAGITHAPDVVTAIANATYISMGALTVGGFSVLEYNTWFNKSFNPQTPQPELK